MIEFWFSGLFSEVNGGPVDQERRENWIVLGENQFSLDMWSLRGMY